MNCIDFTSYSSLVNFGRRLDVAFPGYSINLYAGTTLLASVNQDDQTPPLGKFATALVSYTTGSQLISTDNLSIELQSNGGQTLFDNVRLFSWSVQGQAFDETGNRLSGSGADQSAMGTHNQLQSDGISNFTYDQEGNPITQTNIATGEVREFLWDYRNRLVNVIDRSGTNTITQNVHYTYDAFHRKVGKQLDADGDGIFDFYAAYVERLHCDLKAGDSGALDVCDETKNVVVKETAKSYYHFKASIPGLAAGSESIVRYKEKIDDHVAS